LLNNPKKQELENYLEYILKYLDLVMNDKLNQENFRKIKQELTDKIMIVVRNKPEAIYEVEKKIKWMIEARMPNEEIQRQLHVLRKYSYETYVKNNITTLRSNPKKYHKCLQNIIKWNVELGQEMSLNEQSDMDCSQIYQAQNGTINYGIKAK